jgi:hypothetical protein
MLLGKHCTTEPHSLNAAKRKLEIPDVTHIVVVLVTWLQS